MTEARGQSQGQSQDDGASDISQRIAALLRRSAGLEVELLGTWGVQHAVAERIEALSAAGEPMNAERYLDRVEHDVSEQQWLIEAVVIPETWFFRHHQSFDFIVSAALSRLSTLARAGGSDPSQRVLRIASVPCSTGEEPYSIAMALLDAGIAADRFVIDAIDISHAALSQARTGFYRRNAFRSNRPGFQDRYFDRVDDAMADGWQIKPLVRRCVTFRPGNLVTDLVFAQAQHYDFVLCRNVLIYFDRPTQNAVMTRLSHALRDDGHLLVGPAEAALVSRFGLRPTPAPQAFAFHRPKLVSVGTGRTAGRGAGSNGSAGTDLAAGATSFGRSSLSPLLATLTAMTSTAAHQTASMPRGGRIGDAASSLGGKAFGGSSKSAAASSMPSASAKSASPLSTRVAGKPDGVSPATMAPTASAAAMSPSASFADSAALEFAVALAHARQLADTGQLAQAESVCQGLLIKQNGSADVYCLLGLIADARGQSQQAREHFRRAVYVDAAHADALLQLATHLSRDGDEAGAERLLSRARRARPDLF